MTLLSMFSLYFGSVICKYYGMLLTDCCPVREERAFLMVSLVPNTNSKTVHVFIYRSYYLQNIPTFTQLDVVFVDKGMGDHVLPQTWDQFAFFFGAEM